MSFIISGDTHGTIDIEKLVRFFNEHDGEYTKDDYLIILGDVGDCGFSTTIDSDFLHTIADFPVTTLFIDGNHENFAKLNNYPADRWNGGKVHFITNDIIHLMRGQVFNIDNVTFFTFGGADSIDKEYRTEGVSWFPEEIPSQEEYDEGRRNLEKAGFSVDYILTHTGPREVVAAMGYGELSDAEVELRRYLQNIADNVEFTAWYFGHYHEDTNVEDLFFCLYDEVVVL